MANTFNIKRFCFTSGVIKTESEVLNESNKAGFVSMKYQPWTLGN